MKYFYEIQRPEPLRELSWCNVCFDNLLLETFYLGLSNSRSCLHSQSYNQPSDEAVDHVTLPTRFKVCTKKKENDHPKSSKTTLMP